MKFTGRPAFAFVGVFILSILSPVIVGDSVISTTQVELLPSGSFEESTEWEISTTRGFTQEKADYTDGIVADGSLSFTHSRPDNFDEKTAWATLSDTGSDFTLGVPDGDYTWSTGPDISSSGYEFTGLHEFGIENVSLVLHFAIPDALPQDEVNVLMRNHGADRLLATFVNTLGPVHMMDSPLVVPLDEYLDWDWSKLENTKFTVDYVSDNVGQDDSEVRVDAVGIRVKFHQPWYSFENAKATHSIIGFPSPIIEFGPYDGELEGLAQLSCGLSPTGEGSGSWSFEVEAPPEQELGRIHTFGNGNHTIFTKNIEEGIWKELTKSGDPLIDDAARQQILVVIEDGCISRARIDINDPRMIIAGIISGDVSGLDSNFSTIRFAVGESLVHSETIEIGSFSISIPIGHALPEEGGELEIGIASRFQWRSSGTAETTIVQINSISITGGFEIEWDRDPECIDFEDLQISEDSGGMMIPLESRCSDDITPAGLLFVNANSSDDSIIDAYGEGSNLVISPILDASGTSLVSLEVFDQNGNSWIGDFSVNVEAIPDSPEISGIPPTVFIELGGNASIPISVYDPDTEFPDIQTSKSWAEYENGSLLIEPVSPGIHILEVTASDGTHNSSISLEVHVSAKPDLVIESLEIRKDGAVGDSFVIGDVVEIVGYVRNEGRGDAYNVVFHCKVDGILIGNEKIESIAPGELKMVICDFQLDKTAAQLSIESEIDATDSIEEVIETNNVFSGTILVEGRVVNSDRTDMNRIVTILSVLTIFGSIFLIQMGPIRLKKEFGEEK